MKPPSIELISTLKMTGSHETENPAPLTALLVDTKGEASAKALWQASGMDIDAFYRQLKIEMNNGWIVEPTVAFMKEVEVS